ncbi:hypothetical protein MRB53_038634 [Persea americana]|nr:hypothetical protein MRB53_038634 [Persea americana]
MKSPRFLISPRLNPVVWIWKQKPSTWSPASSNFRRYSASARGRRSCPYSFDNRLSPAIEVMADSGRIRQVLANLIGNSIKFTAERGRISLEAWYEATETGTTAKFVVEDTGVGVKPETLRNLFQPFSQACRFDEWNVASGVRVWQRHKSSCHYTLTVAKLEKRSSSLSADVSKTAKDSQQSSGGTLLDTPQSMTAPAATLVTIEHGRDVNLNGHRETQRQDTTPKTTIEQTPASVEESKSSRDKPLILIVEDK